MKLILDSQPEAADSVDTLWAAEAEYPPTNEECSVISDAEFLRFNAWILCEVEEGTRRPVPAGTRLAA
jgi:hypothetical protein